MADNPSNTDRVQLTPEEARLMIKAIEDVEREEAEAQDKQRQEQESTPKAA